MRTNVPEKLLKLVGDIEAHGDANLTRLTVLKKWFETPGRLTPFALWVAAKASSRKGKTKGDAATLHREAKELLSGLDPAQPELDLPAMRGLLARLRAFQDEYRSDRWGKIRVVRHWQLVLVEKGLAIAVAARPHPSDGYKLAADYCQNYDPRYGNTLNGSLQDQDHGDRPLDVHARSA